MLRGSHKVLVLTVEQVERWFENMIVNFAFPTQSPVAVADLLSFLSCMADNEQQRTCPDCDSPLQPIKLLDKWGAVGRGRFSRNSRMHPEMQNHTDSSWIAIGPRGPFTLSSAPLVGG